MATIHLMDQQLPTLTELIAIGRGFYRAISDCHSVPWGEFSRNDQNPESHDSNHAYLDTPVSTEQFSAVLREIETFYTGTPATARLRYYTAILPPSLLDFAARAGWKTRLEESTWRAWPASSPPAHISEIKGLTIRHVTSCNLESCHLIREEDAAEESRPRLRRTWERLAHSPNVTPLLACLDGEPVAVLAVVWHNQWGCVEEVVTRKRFRRLGICTALLRFAQNLAVERNCHGLMLYDLEEGPDRIYARAGFQLIGKTQCAIAWRE